MAEFGLRHDAANARLHIRTVITNEDNERALRPTHVTKCADFSIYALKREVAGLPHHRVAEKCCPRHRQGLARFNAGAWASILYRR